MIGSVEALPHGPKWDTPKEIGKKIDERIRNAEKQTGVAREDSDSRGCTVTSAGGVKHSSSRSYSPASQHGIGHMSE